MQARRRSLQQKDLCSPPKARYCCPRRPMASSSAMQQAKSNIKSARVEAPACDRNKEPILQVLKKYLPADQPGKVLEVATGTGQHVAHFAPAFPKLVWQPSDCTLDMFKSVTAWACGIENICLPPMFLDVRKDKWPLKSITDPDKPELVTAIFCANMTHISPWAATQGLLAGAGRHLMAGGLLMIYGPFKRDGKHTSESNAQFDASLQVRDPEWGYRDVDQVAQEANVQTGGTLKFVAVEEMPANNLMLIFKQS